MALAKACEMLEGNSVQVLNLDSAIFGERGTGVLAAALQENKSLTKLNLRVYL